MSARKQIIAIGGNTAVSLANQYRLKHPTHPPKARADSLTEDDLKLERYVLAQTGKPKPKICFLATAAGDNPSTYETYYEVMKRLDCEPSHLSLYAGKSPDLRSQLLDQDVIYVNGGNTRNMLTLWRDWGVDLLLREAYEKGIVLAGWSAGSICWFEEGVTDSVPGSLTAMKCLGFLPGSNCPHYDGEKERRPSYHRLLLEGRIKPGIANEDKVALHYIDGKLERVFSPQEGKKAYLVRLSGSGSEQGVQEEPLKATRDGGSAGV